MRFPHRHILTVSILLLSINSNLFAGAPDTLWTRVFGGSGQDISNSIIQTKDGRFISVGTTNSYGMGNEDVHLLCVNQNGDTLWTKTYGSSGVDEGYSVLESKDGGFIIAGITNLLAINHSDIFLIRTNSIGDTIWTKSYGSENFEYGISIQQTYDGGYVIAGSLSYSEGSFKKYFYLIKINTGGDTLWTKTYSGISDNANNFARSIQQTRDSGFIFVGTTFNDTGLTSKNRTQESSKGIFHYIYAMKLNSNGDTIWTRTFGGYNYAQGNAVVQTNDGGFIITGQKSVSDAMFDRDVYLIRMDEHGDTLWTRTYGENGYDEGNDIKQTEDGGFIIAGRSDSFNSGKFDVYLIRTDPKGDTLWTKLIKDGEGKSICLTPDGGYCISGIKNDFPNSDIYIIRLGKETKINKKGKQSINDPTLNNLTVFKNSNNDILSLRYTLPRSGLVKIDAFDVKGTLVGTILNKYMAAGLHILNWDTTRDGTLSIAKGMYFLKVSLNRSTFVTKCNLVQ